MRGHYIIVAILLVLTLSAAYMVVHLQTARKAGAEDLILISAAVDEFVSSNQPTIIVDLDKLYRSGRQRELLQPTHHFGGNLFKLDLDKSSSKADFSKCGDIKAHTVKSIDVDKLRVWKEAQCDLSSKLPKGFFMKGSLMHPSGSSYAYLALSLHPKSLPTENWLRDNVSNFHITELAKVDLAGVDVEESYIFLSALEGRDLNKMVARSAAIMTDHFVLFSSRSNRDIKSQYSVFPLLSFSRFLNDRSYYVEKASAEKSCFYRQGDLCWKHDFSSLFGMLGKAFIVILLGLISTLGFLQWNLLRRLKRERVENDKRKFALEVLTHEFRTPVTNLVLQADKLNKMYSSLQPELQSLCPVISGEIYRLQRLTEETKKYLMSGKVDKLVDLNVEQIHSAN